MKCPRCKKQVSELDEKCQYCGLDFEKYEQKMKERAKTSKADSGYVTGYNVFLWILGILIFIGGIIIGQEETSIIFICWFSGIIFLVIMNMLKNIIEELRKLNDKIDT